MRHASKRMAASCAPPPLFEKHPGKVAETREEFLALGQPFRGYRNQAMQGARAVRARGDLERLELSVRQARYYSKCLVWCLRQARKAPSDVQPLTERDRPE